LPALKAASFTVFYIEYLWYWMISRQKCTQPL